MDSFREAIRNLFSSVLLLGANIANLLIRSFVISVIWNWFLEPAVRFPHLSIMAALGLTFVFGLLSADGRLLMVRQEKLAEDRAAGKEASKSEYEWGFMLGEVIGYGFILFSAFVWHFFI